MLNVNPETVQHLIGLAREFQNDDGPVVPETGEDTADGYGGDLLELLLKPPPGGDTVFREFQATIADLEPDQQQQLVALYWLGRDDFPPEEWQAALDEARRNWNERTADYLIAHPHLADHLREGLEMLGYGGE